ncbi:myozenin-1 [Pyxicephalus adspersus]|uniref:Myozenin-1 n=1 Tax=Pyxicephalus adspersus TaxID=30357 RepID=A0AAV2ZJD7_PYXAD|nr:TPA: hypothetical protein GDO54_004567 [Pyxicephalus adspersus]
MPLAGVPAPNKRKKSTKIIMEITARGEQDLSRLNLGKKISVPRDIMLEELSLLSNKGSKMFKLRQKRVEKFIYENNPDVFSDNSLDHFQKYIPSGQYGVGGQTGGGGGGYGLIQGSGRFVSSLSGGHHGVGGQHPPVPPPKPGSKGGAGGQHGSGGPGGQGGTGGVDGSGGKDGQSGQPGEGGKQITVFKTYISPWEKALGIDPKQAAQLHVNLLEFGAKSELCKYKSFNRSPIPYGGYEKASKLMTFQMPEFDAGPEPEPVTVFNPTVTNRPSFNRTPIGWLGSGDTTNYNIELNVLPVDGETDEL